MDQSSSWSDKLKDTWWSIKRNRSAKIATVAILVLCSVLGIVYAALRYYGKLPWQTTTSTTGEVTTNQNTAVVDLSGTSPRQLDGLEVATIDSNRFPIAVMIENLVDIRPQSGLSNAGLVYEALAEGGITRFMAVYTTSDDIAEIGPIRSARHYFVDWAEEYSGIYAYVGGSPQALGVTDSSNYITDLNQFYNAAYYYRADDIEAPHNLFSSSELFSYALRDLQLADTAGDYTAYTFKAMVGMAERPNTVAPITINYSSADYQVAWQYDAVTNLYRRWNGGVAQVDANTEQPIAASNIVVQRVNTTVLEAATGRLDMETIGSGEAILFQDGAVHLGSWKKGERGERTLFYDQTGTVWSFNPGQTWIEVVPTDTAVTY